MPFAGWGALGGVEVWNSARTMKYVRTYLPTVFTEDVWNSENLAEVLNDEPYLSPQADEAEWYDPDVPASKDFYGMYPLSVAGLADSTRTARVTETAGDGGVVGLLRHATRTVRVTGLLAAKTNEALEAGLVWLRAALRGSQCGDVDGGCGNGDTFCYLSALPKECPPGSDCADPYLRFLREVTVISGLRVIEEFPEPECGGALVRVEFLMVAGTPHPYGITKTVVTGIDVPVVYMPGATVTRDQRVPDCTATPAAPGPILDPDVPLVPSAPRPPVIGDPAVAQVSYGDNSYAVKIPDSALPAWAEAVPVITLTAGQAVRQARVRFYPAPISQAVQDVDPCAYCGDFVISYIPANGTLELDGMTEKAIVRLPGDIVKTADHLLYGSDGGPFTWPTLACGVTYYVVIDTQDSTPLADLSVSVAIRE